MNFSEIVIGPFVIPVGGVFLFMGSLFSVWMITRTVHEKKLSLKFLSDNFFLFLFAGLFAGRAGTIFVIWPTIIEKISFHSSFSEKAFSVLRDVLSFWHGGIDIVWALLGFLLLFFILCLWYNERTLAWLDAFSLPVLLFLLFYEIGGFFAGWGYGSPVDESFPLAISYDLIDVRYTGTIHPVQLYAAMIYFIFFVIGITMWARKIEYGWPSGIFGGIILSVLFLVSGILEFFRGETSYLLFDTIRLSQFVFFSGSAAIFLFMIWRGHFHVFSLHFIHNKQ